ncbi:MAG: phosphodiester glycosidase family protein [Anaerolineae bacterium]
MSNRKTPRGSCLSNLIGLSLIGGIVIALLMFGLSVRDLITGAGDEPQTEASFLATPTLRPTDAPTEFPTQIPAETPIIVEPTDLPTTQPEPEPTEINAGPSDTGWITVQAGLETRDLPLLDPETGVVRERLTIIRLDPAQFRFDVGYTPGNPKTIDAWQRDSGALLVLNAGYFTAEYAATGLTIAQGDSSGSSYGPFAGMVTINGDAPAPNLDVRWLRQTPYSTAENLWGAFQAFPILVHSGGTAAFPASSDNGDQAQRTVIGKDKSGRVLILVTRRSWFTLSEMSSWLAQSDLDLQIAVNLDGGPSTGLILNHPNQQIQVLPFSPLPTVLLMYE